MTQITGTYNKALIYNKIIHNNKSQMQETVFLFFWNPYIKHAKKL